MEVGERWRKREALREKPQKKKAKKTMKSVSGEMGMDSEEEPSFSPLSALGSSPE